MKMKVRVTEIKKGDRFFNEYWGREVIAATDAYRLDGTVDPEHYHPTTPKPKIAVMGYGDGQWHHSWWMIEVGVNDGKGSGGAWSEIEHRSIEVERETAEEQRLEYLRGELRAERISYGELVELQGLVEHIDPSDVELLEAAGVPEHDDE